MLNETEQAQLAALVAVHGTVGVVDGLVTLLDSWAETERTLTRGVSWGHDAGVLRRAVRSLWVRGPGKAAVR